MRTKPVVSPRPAWLSRHHARAHPHPLAWLDLHFAAVATFLIVFGLILWALSPILAPFLAAGILAYIFDPLVDKLETKGVSRTLGTVIAVLGLILGVVLLLVIILPLFYTEISQLVDQFPAFMEQIKTNALPWINQKLGTSLTLDPTVFRQFVTDNLQDAGGVAKKIFASVGLGGMAVVGFIVNLALLPVVLFYVLRDFDTMTASIDGMIPRRFHETTTKLADCGACAGGGVHRHSDNFVGDAAR